MYDDTRDDYLQPSIKSQPRISCLMPTYNRLRRRPDGSIDAVIVEEAIESFVRQQYVNRELFIINDTPGQTLRLPDDPRYSDITLINSPTRFETLGHKYRHAIDRMSGDYFTPWDDDDISLPGRLNSCRSHLRGADVMTVHGFYFMDDDTNKLTFDGQNGYMNDVYSLPLARRVGYPLQSADADRVAREQFSVAADIKHALRPNSSWHFYIYRWRATQRLHLSSLSYADETGYATIGRQPIVEVDYELQPHWQQDYVELVKRHFP
ncbi:MAG: hypothetical protein B7Z37_25620 [Verrucomicrobia bacterium 12-59-8]|nr:MAG: hypothetical protein B7Z37_25620 [Verrucomicrobia bacterium 12-59-8]